MAPHRRVKSVGAEPGGTESVGGETDERVLSPKEMTILESMREQMREQLRLLFLDHFLNNEAGDIVIRSPVHAKLVKHLKEEAAKGQVKQDGACFHRYQELSAELRALVLERTVDAPVEASVSVKSWARVKDGAGELKFFLPFKGGASCYDTISLSGCSKSMREQLSGLGLCVPEMDFGNRWGDMVYFLQCLRAKGVSHLLKKISFVIPDAMSADESGEQLSCQEICHLITALYELSQLTLTSYCPIEVNSSQTHHTFLLLQRVIHYLMLPHPQMELETALQLTRAQLFGGAHPLLTLRVPSTQQAKRAFSVQVPLWAHKVAVRLQPEDEEEGDNDGGRSEDRDIESLLMPTPIPAAHDQDGLQDDEDEVLSDVDTDEATVVGGGSLAAEMEGLEMELGLLPRRPVAQPPAMIPCTWLLKDNLEPASAPFAFPTSGQIYRSQDMMQHPYEMRVLDPSDDHRRQNASIAIGTRVGADEWSTRQLGETFIAGFVEHLTIDRRTGNPKRNILPLVACRCHTLPLALGLPDMHGLMAIDYDTSVNGLIKRYSPAGLRGFGEFNCVSASLIYQSRGSIPNNTHYIKDILLEGQFLNPALFWHSRDAKGLRNILFRVPYASATFASDLAGRLLSVPAIPRPLTTALERQVLLPHRLSPYHHLSLGKYFSSRARYTWMNIEENVYSLSLQRYPADQHVKNSVAAFFKSVYGEDDEAADAAAKYPRYRYAIAKE